VPRPVKSGSGKDQNGRIDEKRQHQSGRKNDRSKFDRFALPSLVRSKPASAQSRSADRDYGHDGCAGDADADIKHHGSSGF
jgi:hypothetical protein